MKNKRKKEGKNEKRKRRKKKGQIKQKGNTIKSMKCRIGFRINSDLLQNSKGNKRKMEGKTKRRKQRNIQIKVKHINEIQN